MKSISKITFAWLVIFCFPTENLLAQVTLNSPSNNSEFEYTQNVVELSWQEVNSADSYLIQLSRNQNFLTIELETETVDTVYKAYLPIFGTTYYWRVKVNTDEVWSETRNLFVKAFDFFKGSGTPEDPYHIENIQQLQKISFDYMDKHFIQMADIDASSTKYWNIGEGFYPLGFGLLPFSGSYNGNGYRITNLWISRTQNEGVALFGSLTGTIDSIVLDSVYISGSRYTGGITANNVHGTISNTRVSGTIISNNEFLGGIVGANNGDVSNSSFSGILTGRGWMGGIAGMHMGGQIENTRSEAVINGTWDGVGGIVGRLTGTGNLKNSITHSTVVGIVDVGGVAGIANESAQITNAISTGSVSGTENVGALVGSSAIPVVNSYWDAENSGNTKGIGRGSTGDATGLTTSDLTGNAALTSLTGFDFEEVWKVTDGYPALRWEDTPAVGDDGDPATIRFYLAENGVTIMCPDAAVGETGEVGVVTYEAVDRALLIQRRDEGADLTKVCTSPVTDMSEIFMNARSFNDPINHWDVSNVVTFFGMFRDAEIFNQPLEMWDMISAQDLGLMFTGALKFDQPIGSWNVSNVNSLAQMFDRGTSFNQDISGWDVSNVTSLEYTFYATDFFNQDLSGWDVSNVRSMIGVFSGAKSFNQPLNDWDVSSAVSMYRMFEYSVYNHPISSWDVKNVTNMDKMFYHSDFNHPINNWCVPSITSEPENFAIDSPLAEEKKPVWGTCPESPAAFHTEIVDVTNPATGRVWMDRNLGASRAATSSIDDQAYGDLYQWGRAADGHEKRNSTTTTTLSSGDQPGHGSFIISISSGDWRNPQNDNLWQGVNGVNNPCPVGYRLPTEAEWESERVSWSSNNAIGAFASQLKLTIAGRRNIHGDGLIDDVGSGGGYWSSSVDGGAIYLHFWDSTAFLSKGARALGFSVRCIKDSDTTPVDPEPEPEPEPEAFAATFNVSDAGASSLTLTIGTAADATEGFDSQYDVYAPPPPPDGAFDARIIRAGDAYFADFQPVSTEPVNWVIRFSPEAGLAPVTLSWNPADFSEKGTFRLRDAIDGSFVNLDMRTETSYTATQSFITSVVVHFDPLDPIGTPLLLSPSDKQTRVDRPVTFAWTQTEGALRYKLLAFADATLQDTLTSIITSDTTASYDQLDAFTEYFWHVIASNDQRTGQASEVSGFRTALSGVTLQSPDHQANNLSPQPSLKWTQDANATAYDVRFISQSEAGLPKDTLLIRVGNSNQFDMQSDNYEDVVTGESKLADSLLDFATIYSWQVRSVSGQEPSVWSEARTFSTVSRVVQDGTFRLPITFTDSNENSMQLTIGASAEATGGFDAGIDAPAPPPAPDGEMDVRILRGVDSYFTDIQSLNESVSQWLMSFKVSSGGRPMLLSWDPEKLADAGSFRLQDTSGGATINVNMREQSSVSIQNSNITQVLITHFVSGSGLRQVDMELGRGWNMIGLPVLSEERDYRELLPGVVDLSLFSFGGTYNVSTMMEPGVGYWVRMGTEAIVNFEGGMIDELEIPIRNGWNLISGPSFVASVGSVVDPGKVLLTNTLYRFRGAYEQTTLIAPSSGYWIRASKAGTVTIRSAFMERTIGEEALAFASIPPGFAGLAVQSESGHAQVLYIGGSLHDDVDVLEYSLPPVPPAGAFDVRFDGDMRLVQGVYGSVNLQRDGSAMLVGFSPASDIDGPHGAVGPPVFYESGDVLIVTEWMGSLKLNRMELSPGDELLRLNDATDRLEVELRQLQSDDLPQEVTLSQNFPNPFNPSTTIRYALPEAAQVRLEVYTMAGQRVAVLASGEQRAGWHTVSFDGSSLASGVYIYRLQAGGFVQTRKLILIK
jgi:uncharacterized protein (TIGR02145 family)